ncbi:hypothetical protein NVA59_005314 [Escherichia coli]|nr:hypothetical protein [Escherichia coli]
MKKIIIFLLIIAVLLVSYFLINRDDKEENLNLNTELKLESENKEIKEYNFSITNVETEPITITFKQKNDISIALKRTEGNEENITSKALLYDIPEREMGDKITLKSNETLAYPIKVDTKKLTPGKYELIVNFSAENVEVIKQTIDIVIR